jgi:nitric oxide reductase NorD protein
MHDALSLKDRLDQILEVEYTFRSTATPVAAIGELPLAERRYAIDWVERVASTNIELGYQYACRVSEALAGMDQHQVEAWALHAMDTYDREGLRPALEVIRRLDRFARERHERASGCVLEEKRGILHGFLQGLSGRRLKLEESDQIYTDTETLYLPPVLARLPDENDNFILYKVMMVTLWAQIRYGTFRCPLTEILAKQPDPERFLHLFQALEALRLEALIERELPGLHREMERIRGLPGEAEPAGEWHALRRRLARPGTRVTEAVRLAEEQQQRLEPGQPPPWQGVLQPELVEACMAARLEREKAKFRVTLKLLEDEHEPGRPPGEREKAGGSRFSKRELPAPELPEGMRTEILLDGKPMPLPEEVKGLISSIIVDLGEIPDAYLEPAGPGAYDPALFQDEVTDPDDVWSGVYHEEGAHLYREWDYRRQHYRKNWCAVREKSVTPVYDGFVEETLERYVGLVKHLRRIFEAMRDENRLLKRQNHGDNVDLDALVEALADARDGREMSERLFTRMHRTERNIAVIFMVDMSGSTKGWINDAERESLVLLCESLETLGDRYAIYGFSSITRKRCELYHIKHFDEPYAAEVKARISGIRPHDYTRMGFAIRHLTRVLSEVDARTRVLITLSDGKPDDYDSYRGDYGIEDTRRALIEARREGVHPYCITIDEQARDYLPRLYGPAAYTVIDDVRILPLKVSDIYRRLTT